MKKIGIFLFALGCIGFIALRELTLETTRTFIDDVLSFPYFWTGNNIIRRLCDETTDPDVAKVCSDIDFDDSAGNGNSVVKSIRNQRNKEKELSKFLDGGEVMDFIMSLAQYCIPWLALFILSLISM